WEDSGRCTPLAAIVPSVTVAAANTAASRVGPTPGAFTFTRTGDTSAALTVSYSLGGSAVNGLDYQPALTNGAVGGLVALAGQVAVAGEVTIPAGVASTTLPILPLPATNIVGAKSIMLTVATNSAYALGSTSLALLPLG